LCLKDLERGDALNLRGLGVNKEETEHSRTGCCRPWYWYGGFSVLEGYFWYLNETLTRAR